MAKYPEDNMVGSADITLPCSYPENNASEIATNINEKDDFLTRIEEEKQLSKANRIEIECRWRKVLRTEKLESLRRDVLDLKKVFEQKVKKEDETIQILLQDFEEAEDQYLTAISSHFQSLEELINLHDSSLLTMEKDFNKSLDFLRSHYHNERADLTKKYQTDKQMVIDEISSLESEEKRTVADEIRDQQQHVEEVRNKNLEDINSLRFILDSKIEDLEDQFESAHMEYLQKTNQRSERVKALDAKDKEKTKEISDLQRKVDKLQSSIKRLKNTSQQNSLQLADKNRQLVERKNAAIERYQDTKGKMQDFCSFQHQKLKELTKHANGCKAELEKKCKLAEKILKLAALGGKLESEQEGLRNLCSIYNEDQEEDVEEYHMDKLGGVWRKYNKVLLDVANAQKEEKALREQNRILKENLKKYRDGISVNDDVIRSNNPLIVINGKMSNPTPPNIQKQEPIRRMTVVDANHAFATFHAR